MQTKINWDILRDEYWLNKEDLFKAYYDCRKNKRNSKKALEFEIGFESKLLELYEEIIAGNYAPKPGYCFIVKKPVKREVFAPDFRDRIVHHLLFYYLSPVFEKTFINDSYSCRKGKGTHYGIKRIDHFIRSCSDNYRRDCYILKLDVQGYFMGIDRKFFFDKIKTQLDMCSESFHFDVNLVLHLLNKVIFNDATKNCIIKGHRKDWQGLPAAKSLFNQPSGKGLPIGNLTSQLFGNIYLNEFDHFVKKDLGIRYYGRYVDDFILIHPNKKYLSSLIPPISDYLNNNLKLTLHPHKVYLQHFAKGVKYLGAVIKPNRMYVANRTLSNFYTSISKHNFIARQHKPDKREKMEFRCCMNSYLGLLKHYKTYEMRKRIIIEKLSGWWWNYILFKNGYSKGLIKN
ncbi:MAG: reverse transcriptase/maturase family protein [Bacteroidales bacterium]|nr:reverse transcriptase/maturase family protein [Bacteroidales bacterium]